MANQYPASWRIWLVRGTGRTGKPVVFRVKADDYAAAIAKCATYGLLAVAVTSCVMIAGPAVRL